MFSGKSCELIRRIRRYQLSDFKCILIRYAKDARFTAEEVTTHNGKTFPAVLALNLNDIYQTVQEYEVIGIDEGQFFPDIVEFCKDLLSKQKIIVVAGLDGTYERTPFGEILNLVPLAKTVDKLSAICMSCGKKASFTRRRTKSEEVEVIGGIDKYMAVCRECYKLRFLKKSSPFKNMELCHSNGARSPMVERRTLFTN
ncbi:hypothetical protein AAG570_012041 [Ranatra chinensis]|uniref:Thymidine kinase n=1 Tax=Ranatra chinensis TaxID=642074 RepID=A0ABD0YHM1_9HEMI